DLEVERGTRPDQPSEHCQEGNQHRHNRDQSLPFAGGKFDFAKWYGVFGRHTGGGEHDDVIETFASYGSDKPFGVCVLPRRARRRDHFLNADRLRRRHTRLPYVWVEIDSAWRLAWDRH